MDAVLFFSTLGGTLVGFFLALLTTAVRERANMTVTVRDCERVWVVENMPDDGVWDYRVTSPEEATELVLTVHLSVANLSGAYDAITECELEVDGVPLPARVRADERFEGVNVPPRQTAPQKVRFFVPRQGIGRDGVAVDTAAWAWRTDGDVPVLRLRWTSVRRRLLGGRRGGTIELTGPWKTLHRPGSRFGYLHAKPS